MSHRLSNDRSSNRSKSLLETKGKDPSSDRSRSALKKKKKKKTFTKSVPVLAIQSAQNVEEAVEWISYTKYENKEYQRIQWRCLRVYTGYNAVRWLVVAILIIWCNYDKQHRIEEYQSDCCRCYFVAKSPSKWRHINDTQRMDLSYCIPNCTDCNFCESSFSNGTLSPDYTQYIWSAILLQYAEREAFKEEKDMSCPAEYQMSSKQNQTTKYHRIGPSLSLHWEREMGCTDNVSISTLVFFFKNYRRYGIVFMAFMVLFYIPVTISLVSCGKACLVRRFMLLVGVLNSL